MPTHRQAQDSIRKKKPQVLIEAKAAEGDGARIINLALFHIL